MAHWWPSLTEIEGGRGIGKKGPIARSQERKLSENQKKESDFAVSWLEYEPDPG